MAEFRKCYFVFALIVCLSVALAQECSCSTHEKDPFQFSGKVDDCCCDYKTVEDIHHEIAPLLEELTKTSFFKYFKVNLDRPCPYWDDESQCMLRDCSVQESEESEVPAAILEKEKQLSTVDLSNQGAPLVTECSFSEKDFCVVEGANDNDCTYVDLARNPETYTGFAGEHSHRIWNAIYNENCFPVNSLESKEDQCIEKRIFYRVISGMHSSIAAHLSARHYNMKKQKWEFNGELFEQRLGSHPDRVKNLYFVYLLVLRSITKLSDYLTSYEFSTGNPVEDAHIEKLVSQLVTFTMSCPSTFDENIMFQDLESQALKVEFKQHFRNISRIMDCVGCDKCRLWGKLQVMGYGTAMKILFSYDNLPQTSHIDYGLIRNELVALFQLLNLLSESMGFLEHHRKTYGSSVSYMAALGEPFNALSDTALRMAAISLTTFTVVLFVFAVYHKATANAEKAKNK